jgi:hypothetical protein
VDKASELVAARGRHYVVRGKYRIVQVFFSEESIDIDLVLRCFGGHKYPHGSGFTWQLSKKSEIARLLKDLEQRNLTFKLQE